MEHNAPGNSPLFGNYAGSTISSRASARYLDAIIRKILHEFAHRYEGTGWLRLQNAQQATIRQTAAGAGKEVGF